VSVAKHDSEGVAEYVSDSRSRFLHRVIGIWRRPLRAKTESGRMLRVEPMDVNRRVGVREPARETEIQSWSPVPQPDPPALTHPCRRISEPLAWPTSEKEHINFAWLLPYPISP